MAIDRGRAKGAPYRVLDSYGILTGADYIDSGGQWDGDGKYDRYRQMWLSDAEISATLALIEWPYLSATWTVEGDDDRAVEFIQSCVFDPMHPQALPWRQLLQEILFYRRLGNMLFERVWFKRPDGLVGSYLSPRPPESIWSWNLDGIRIASVVQEFYDDEGKWVRSAPIEAKDLVHFVWGQEANNVEGTSILRSCWGDFFSKQQCRNIRNILVERSGGVLKLVRRDGRISKGEDDDAVTTARDYLAHQKNYIVESDAYGVEWQPTGMADAIGKAQEIVEYADQTYRRRILADFMNIGRQQSGSRAVASVQESPFWASMVGDALYITGKLRTEWFAPMVRANFGEGVDVPRLSFTDLRAKDGATELSPLFQAITSGSVQNSPELERYILRRAGAPDVAVDAVEDAEDLASVPQEKTQETAPEGTEAAIPAATPSVALNGAQIDAALTILANRTSGAIDGTQAAALLSALGLPPELVSAVLGSPGSAPVETSPPEPTTGEPKDEAREEDVEVEAPEEEEVAPLSLAYMVDVENPSAFEGRLFRDPIGLEDVIDFQDVGEAWVGAEEEARDLLREFRQKVAANTANRAAPILALGKALTPEDLKTIQSQTKFIDEYARKLSAVALKAIGEGREDVGQELKKLAKKLNAPARGKAVRVAAEIAESPMASEPALRDFIRSYSVSIVEREAAKLTQAAATKAADLMARPMPTKDMVAEILESMDGLSHAEAFAGARTIATQGYQGGRSIEAIKSGAEYAVYSTLFEDGRSCWQCMKLEQKVYEVGSEEWLKIAVPNPLCLSAGGPILSGENKGKTYKNATNNCRCFFVYSIEAVPEEDADA